MEVYRIMTMAEALKILQDEYSIKDGPVGVPHGQKLKLDNGVTVIVYDKGTYQVQGKEKEKQKVEELLKSREECQTSRTETNRKVFVVYGHDEKCRNELENMLRKWRLDPLILENLPSSGQTIIEKLEENMSTAGFAIVLLTPDDEGRKAGVETGLMGRARQNVILEMGMLLSKLGRSKVAILHKMKDLELPSDVHGLLYIPFDESLKESQVILAREISKALGIIISADMM